MNEITERAQTILEASSRVWSSVVEENTIITSNVIEREYLRNLEGVFTVNLVQRPRHLSLDSILLFIADGVGSSSSCWA